MHDTLIHRCLSGVKRRAQRLVLPTRPVGTLARYLPRALHILKTEGVGVLIRKLKRRWVSTPLWISKPPRLLVLTEPYAPLDFTPRAEPEVSLIVPVHGHFAYTHHCLAAIAAANDAIIAEIIVVDDASPDDTAERLAHYPGLRLIRHTTPQGFVNACNQGARIAGGRYLVFLNNDTQAQPGWLDALISTFHSMPEAGLVGSRLLYPDGRLQEAGALLFRDGSAWQCGHLDDPNKPEYGYLCPADYCSGAALAIETRLFRQLGGFDPAFSPGYYEDADLAMRVRAAGRAVYYQPLSQVVHFEGISAGRDERVPGSMKSYQRLHAEIFRSRWVEALATHCERGGNLERCRDRYAQRRALIIDRAMITPDRDSGSVRMGHLLRVLQRLGFQVTFAASHLEAPLPYVTDLQGAGIEVLYRPFVRHLQDHLSTHGERYDLVLLSRADTATDMLDQARRHCPNAFIVFDTVDLHFLRELRLAELTGDPTLRRTAQNRRRQELELMRRADLSLVVSEVERALLAQEASQLKVEVVSNIYPVEGCARPFAQRRGLLFIGAFAHPPNTDAVLFLCHEIMPRLRSMLPGVQLTIIGSDPPRAVICCGAHDIAVLGHVPNLTPLLASSRISVAPLRYGAGVKGKINLSLAHGLPVVATSVGAEGMHLVDGESVLIADQAETFAAAVARLDSDESLWQRLSDGGLRVTEEYFGFASAERAMRRALSPVLLT